MIYFLAFFSGIIIDLWRGNALGLSSFLFLIFLFIFQLYKRKFTVFPPLFVFVFVVLSSLIYFRIILENWMILGAVILGLVGVILRSVFLYFSVKGGGKLKVGL